MDSRIARPSGTVKAGYHVGLAESLVAATALATGTTVMTRNVKDCQRIPAVHVRAV